MLLKYCRKITVPCVLARTFARFFKSPNLIALLYLIHLRFLVRVIKPLSSYLKWLINCRLSLANITLISRDFFMTHNQQQPSKTHQSASRSFITNTSKSLEISIIRSGSSSLFKIFMIHSNFMKKISDLSCFDLLNLRIY